MSKKVIILGGGVGGMSAAHELVERGFDVEVYERRPFAGGKARSVAVPDTGKDGRNDLPGEHGFRFFPRFYQHVIDTMKRIPCADGRCVADNLTETTAVQFARYGLPPILAPVQFPRSLSDMKILLGDAAHFFNTDLGISEEEEEFFEQRIWQILTSCEQRRMSEYEQQDWWDYIGAGTRSEAYQKFLGHGITRSLVAAQAHLASTKTIGDIFVQLVFNIVEPGISADRVLNGPTNEVWITPWRNYLEQRGVKYHLNSEVISIHCLNGAINGVTVKRDGVITEVQGDYFVAAVPIERMVPLINQDMRDADPMLGNLLKLRDNTRWMNGIQFYLTEDVAIVRGHMIYVDSPWALTSISQKQFWPNVDLSQYGDGTIKGIISVDISEWEVKGGNGKTAKECTRDEIMREVWDQVKRSVNVGDQEVLQDAYLGYCFLDPDIHPFEGQQGPGDASTQNEEPLLVNYVNTWRLRPDAKTDIPNLFLASDYVRTNTDLATMEGANEAARRAVNAIIVVSGVGAPPCAIWNLHEPEFLAPWRAYDGWRFRKGLPWDGTIIGGIMRLQDMASFTFKAIEQAASVVEQGIAAGLDVAREAERRFLDVQPVRVDVPEGLVQRFRQDALDAVDIGFDLVTLGGMKEATVQIRSTDPAVVSEPVARGGVAVLRLLHTVRPGQSVRLPIVVENTSRNETVQVALSCTDLLSRSGNRISASMSFAPNPVVVAPRGAAPVNLTLILPVNLPSGLYSALLQATTVDAVQAVLVVQVD